MALLFLLAGCDRVFGVALPIDSNAVPDGVALVSVGVAGEVAERDTVEVTLDLVGPPGVEVDFVLSAERGSVEDGTGVVVIERTGEARVVRKYTAPETAGPERLVGSVGGMTKDQLFTVLELGTAGNDSVLDAMTTIGAHSFFTTAINVPQAGTLRALGMQNLPAGARVVFGLYAQGTLLVSSTIATCADFRTVAETPRIALAPGQYSIGMLTDANVTVRSTPGGTNLMQGQAFGDGVPADLNGTNEVSGTLALFLEYAY